MKNRQGHEAAQNPSHCEKKGSDQKKLISGILELFKGRSKRKTPSADNGPFSEEEADPLEIGCLGRSCLHAILQPPIATGTYCA